MLISLLRRSGRFLRCERAVATLEYAVLAGVALVGIGTAIVAFTDDIALSITQLGDQIETGTGTVQDANFGDGGDGGEE